MSDRSAAGTSRTEVASSRSIRVRVLPRSRRESVDLDRERGIVVVRTSAAPVDGSANERVVALLAEHYGVRRRQVEIIKGQRSRDKVVRVTGSNTI